MRNPFRKTKKRNTVEVAHYATANLPFGWWTRGERPTLEHVELSLITDDEQIVLRLLTPAQARGLAALLRRKADLVDQYNNHVEPE